MDAPVVDTVLGAGRARLRTLRWVPPRPVGRVVLVHGFGDHAGRYQDLARALTDAGWGLFAFDLRGHGGSHGRRGSGPPLEVFLDDLDLVLAEVDRALPGAGGPFLYGHSFGGLVVTRWLQERTGAGVSGAVLSAPWLATALAIPGWKRRLARMLIRLAPDLAIPSGSDDPAVLTRDPARAEAYRVDPLVHHLISAGFHQGVLEAQEQALAGGLPPGLPALVLVPAADRLVDPEVTRRWAEALGPAVEVRVLGGCHHEPHNDLDRDATLAGVVAWLDACRRGEPGRDGRVSSGRTAGGTSSRRATAEDER